MTWHTNNCCILPTIIWVVPSQTTRITVANLLPSGVTILPDSSGFTVSAASALVTRTLSQDCSACVATNGLIAPKPAFVATPSTTTSVPADISSATLTGGTLQVVFNHNYTFDPLRPSVAPASAKGYAVITVSNGTSVIGRDSIDGATTALPANTPLTRSIPLSGTISGSSPRHRIGEPQLAPGRSGAH